MFSSDILITSFSSVGRHTAPAPVKMRRGYSKKRLTPECVRGEALSYVPRFHPACQRHRDARQDNRNTRRPNERSGKARRQVRHSVEQLAAAEGVQRGNWPLVTSCNGKAPARSSRAALEWYQPSLPQSTFSTGRPSLGGRFRLLLLLSRFNTGTISPPQPIVKSVQAGYSPYMSFSLVLY